MFASSQDGITGPGFTVLSESEAKIHETMVFKILDIRQQRAMIIERWQTNEVTSYNDPTSACREIPRFGREWGKPDLWGQS